jgi:hypothetical protein
MKSMLQPEIRDEVRRRLASIPADRVARWGRMDAAQMMAHLANAMRMSLGDLPVREKRHLPALPPVQAARPLRVPVSERRPHGAGADRSHPGGPSTPSGVTSTG